MKRGAGRLCAAMAMLVLSSWARAGVPVSSLAEAVSRAVQATLPPGLGIADVVPPALAFEGGEITVDWRSPPRPGRVAVMVNVRADGRAPARGYAWVELRMLRRVVVTRRACLPGELVTADDFAIESRPVAPGVGLDVAPAALAGSRVEHALSESAIVRQGDVTRPPPMGIGSPVRVEVRRGLVRVVAQGVLERPAEVGGPAVARLVEGHRLIRGRMTAPGVVWNDGSEP